MKRYNTITKKTNTKCASLYTIIVALLFGITACTKTKSLPACTGNCSDVSFSGMIYDPSSNAPLGNVEIKVYLNPTSAGYLIPPDNYIVASGKTDGNGNFNFHAQYDTVKFMSSVLEVNAYIPNGYIQYPQQIDTRTEPSASDNIDALLFNSTDFSKFSHVNFTMFQKTLLQIHMHRTSPIDNNAAVDVGLFASGVTGGYDGFIQTEANKDTTVSAYTGFNMYTVVTTTKAISANAYASVKDSVKCTKNGPNSIDVYY